MEMDAGRTWPALCLSLLTTGCGDFVNATNFFYPLGTNTPKIRYATLNDGSSQYKLFAWDAESNIAYISPTGQSCMMAASIAREGDLAGSLSVENVEIADVSYDESVRLLSNKDNLATFLDVAMFHFCVLSLNNTDQYESPETLHVYMVNVAAMIQEIAEQQSDLPLRQDVAGVLQDNAEADQ